MSVLRAITFDLDDTLWAIEPVITRAEARVHEWFRRHCPRVVSRFSIEGLRELRLQEAAAHPELAHDFTTLRKRSLLTAVTSAGYEPAAAETAFDVFLAERNAVTLYTDVLPALQALSRRFHLGVISNGNADISVIGLDVYFRFALSAAQVGASKPAAAIFQAASTAAGVAAENILHVGDDPECDVHGATIAGLQAVWLNRDGRAWPHHLPAPARMLSSLAELPRLLDEKVATPTTTGASACK